MADHRSRRETKPKLDKLAAYKRARQGEKRKTAEDEDYEIYDEVTEEQYKSIVKGRLQRDDFIVDDGAEGYVDNGMEEDWGRADESEPDSEEERRARKAKRKAKEDDKKKKTKVRPPSPEATINDYRPVVSAAQEEDFMANILGDLDAPAVDFTSTRPRKRKPSFSYESSSPAPHRTPSYGDLSSDAGSDHFDLPLSSDDFMSPKKKPRTDTGAVTPAIDKMASLGVYSDADSSFDDIDMNAFNDIDDDDLSFADVKPAKPAPPPVKPEPQEEKPFFKLQAAKPKKDPEVPSWLSVYDSLAVTESEKLGSLASSSTSSASSSNISALEPDGSLRFYWLDYLELDGNIYFTGKLKDKTSGAWVSCCVTVENMQRNLFVLPREKCVEQDEDGALVDTDQIPTDEDVKRDFDMMRRKLGIKSFRSKFVKRSYAFGISEVPRGESRYLKVVYSFKEPQIPETAMSPCVLRIFGTNTSAFELLVLKRKIMGPCWLQIKNPEVANKGVSWCKLEVTVTDPKDIRPFSDADPLAPKEIPPLTIMSLSMRTIVNHKENKREVVCCSTRLWHNMDIDDPTPPEKLPCTVSTFVRPLGVSFPANFENTARAKSKGCITPLKNERTLINSLLVSIYKADPDVIVGHEFLGVSLDVLLHRMRDLKADHWSRIGRFRRSKWPNIGKQGTNLRFLNGRMLCDISSDGAKSMIASTTWSLTEMCSTHLKNERQDIDPDDTASYFDSDLSSPERLMTFLRHCELDAHYQMAIAAKVQILPLTRQLTTLAGNSWNKTLSGGRAERNEYILLHEFHRLKYICPDKSWGKKHAAAVKMESQEDDPEAAKTTKGKKDKYKGGMVFEPKRGLWDKFILVMDFNSLYPSIIQEYNIDFTTVERADDEDEVHEQNMPEPPSPEVSQGVLPRLIATLVRSRRQVKSVMKDKDITPARYLQLDIRQQALKLTANTMYGCLGSEYSRFFARPLAALTTHKGREILTHTRELAESLGLDVIYGDTDSIFVNSGVTELAAALKISAEFKRAVNERYKLLEIDLDGVFKRLLLLQKKKYAALKVEDDTRTSTEVKGLDMKRREYCVLSKNVSQFVLEQILSGEAAEVVVENIHEYLATIGANIREGKVKVDDFIIFKRLGKNPEEYPDAKSQPHVQVALRMKERKASARTGDVIPYVFCIGQGEESSKSSQADKAKHPDELRKADSGLKIDYEYYLAHQVLPPIERLCDPIEGTDRSRLAECLGLDPGRYRAAGTADFDERALSTLESQMSDKDRYRDALPFYISCRNCQCQLAFAPLYDRESSILLPQGPTCLNCSTQMSTANLQIQLEKQIRDHIARYYEMWTVCSDQTCGNRTRAMGVYGRRCLKPGCRGVVTFEYSDAQLYNQLRYYGYLFDPQKANKAATGTSKSEDVLALTKQHARFLQAMSSSVEKYLNQCGRGWVDMSALFSFMKV